MLLCVAHLQNIINCTNIINYFVKKIVQSLFYILWQEIPTEPYLN